MSDGKPGVVSRQLLRLFGGGGTVAGLTEGALLDRFIARRDEAAFEAILTRHGPMVLSVCRRWLDDPNDVDDAFQATFLVLVRKAGSLRNRDLLGNWLFGVAQKVAKRARVDAARRRAREESASREAAMTTEPLDHPEDFRPLFEELARLPDSYRAPVLLCDMQGLTHAEAADRLGWPLGTVKGRLSRARDQLRNRLTRRGITLPAVALSAALAREGLAAVPQALTANTLRAALSVAAGRTVATAAVSASAAALSEGVVSTMYYAKLKVAAVGLVASATLAVGAGAGAFALQQPSAGGVPKDSVVQVGKNEKIAFLTTTATPMTLADLQKQYHESAKQRLDYLRVLFETGRLTFDRYLEGSRHLLDVELDDATSPADRKRAFEEYVERARAIVKREESAEKAGVRSESNIAEARAAALDASYLLAREEAAPTQRKVSATKPASDPLEAVGQMEDPPDDEAEKKKNNLILAALDRIVPFTFASPTPLEDIIKYVKDQTTTPELPQGLPIYVDPQGFPDDESLTSPIQISLEGVPLKRTLKLVLDQLGLAYTVEHGLLIIDGSQSSRMPWVKERIKQQREAGMARVANMRLMSPLIPGNPPQAEPAAATKGSPTALGDSGFRRAADQPTAPDVSAEALKIAKERLAVARMAFNRTQKLHQNAAISLRELNNAAIRVAEYEFDAASTEVGRIAALRSQLPLLKSNEKMAEVSAQRGTSDPAILDAAKLARLDVEYRLAKMGVAIEETPKPAAPPVNVPPAPAAK